MPSWESILLVTLSGFALSASPGPSMLYVLSRSMGQSRTAGLASAIGLGLGGVLLAIAGALGLVAVFTHFEFAYWLVKFGGAAYLVYLGVQMIRSDDDDQGQLERVKPQGFWHICYQGAMVELLNPKTLLFFVAFLPQFVDAERGSLTFQMLLLGMLVPLTALPSDVLVALTGGTLAKKVAESRTVRRTLSWLGGLFLIGLGVRIVLEIGPAAA